MRTRFSHMTLPLACLGMCCLIMSTTLTSCSSVQEARTIVAQADSLWIAGAPCSDSAALASAAATLEPLRLFYPTDYAHANYHYGRLLRNLSHHPAAMQAFLRVTHSRTNDHAIKGRAWSNIGTICNWAGEYALSYEMYSRCAQHFLLCNDSLMYYNALNAMAFQLASQQKANETLSLLDIITKECGDRTLLAQVWETKAHLYIRTAQYDSAIYAANHQFAYGYYEATGYVYKAQAFWYLNQFDSALFYAEEVMKMSNTSPRDRYNMLYILTYNDSTLSKEQLSARAEERADIDKEILDPLALQFSQAVQILEEDLHHHPSLTWIWATLVTLFSVGMLIIVYVRKKSRENQLISQQVELMLQKHDELSEQNSQLEKIQLARQSKALCEIESFCASLNMDSFRDVLRWDDFDQMSVIVNQRMFGLVDKLKEKGIRNPRQIQLCILVVIGKFPDKQIADILYYANNTVRSTKKEIAKTLGTSGKNLRFQLLQMAIG